MTTMAYIMAGACVLLAIIGMVWYYIMTKKSEQDKSENEEESEQEDIK